MFETAVVRARSTDRRFGLLSFSVTIHTAVIFAIIAASLSSTRFPEEAPKQMLPLFLMPAITLPPALGAPKATPKPQPVPGPVAKTPAPSAATPLTIPEAITPVSEQSSTGPTGATTEVGVPWGEKGGIPVDGPPASGLDTAGPLPVGGDVKAPVTIRRVDPLYPRIALQGRVSGWAVLQCIIDRTGHIRDVRVMRSSFGAFEQPAIDAVQLWLFAPGTLNGQPVDTIFELTVRFQLR
jgi:protein TonB